MRTIQIVNREDGKVLATVTYAPGDAAAKVDTLYPHFRKSVEQVRVRSNRKLVGPDDGDAYMDALLTKFVGGYVHAVEKPATNGTPVNAYRDRLAALVNLGDVPGHPFRGNQWKEGDGGGSDTTVVKPKSILDIPREAQPPQEDKWKDFDTLAEGVKRLGELKFKGVPITEEHGFTFEKKGQHIHVSKDGKLLGKARYVWTKKGPQFRAGGWHTYQNY